MSESGFGTGVKAAGDLFGGLAALTSARQKSALLRRASDHAARVGTAESEQELRSGGYLAGMAAVNAGASGGGFQGSALDVMRDIERTYTRNALQSVRNGANQARQYRYEAQVATQQGWFDFGQGVMNAVATIWGG